MHHALNPASSWRHLQPRAIPLRLPLLIGDAEVQACEKASLQCPGAKAPPVRKPVVCECSILGGRLRRWMLRCWEVGKGHLDAGLITEARPER